MFISTKFVMLLSVCLSQTCCTFTSGEQGMKSGQATPNFPASPSLAVSQSQKSGEDHFAEANILRDRGKYEEAVQEYKLAIANGYDTNWLRTELGRVLARYLHRHEEAIEQYRFAIQRDKNEWRAHSLLSDSLLETKQYDEALKELQISKQLDAQGRSNGFYDYYTAKAFDGLGRYDEAVKDYQAFLKRAEKEEPNSPRVREVKARLEALQKTKP
jgi:tetratricopeptide (TPR) repeat protein